VYAIILKTENIYAKKICEFQGGKFMFQLKPCRDKIISAGMESDYLGQNFDFELLKVLAEGTRI
jgi:hypothetical protein